jgi:HlyD family secretion protein
LAYKLSKGDYSSLQQRYVKTKNDLFLSLQNARSQEEIMAEDASYSTVKSDMHGLLYETYKKQGEAVRRNEAVAYIGSENKMYLQLWIDEEDVYKIKEGQEAVITIDMYKEKVFKAVISKIYPVLNAENQSVRVDAEFKEDMPALVANASAEANIIISKKDKGLAISKNLVFGEDSVLVKTSDGSKKVKIKKGIEATDYVEVVSGLDINSEVISNVKE